MKKNQIERSHSKWSNFKLTINILLLIIFFYSLWIILIFKDVFNQHIFYIISATDILLLLLILLSLKKFKR